jgi:hypothetical protein
LIKFFQFEQVIKTAIAREEAFMKKAGIVDIVVEGNTVAKTKGRFYGRKQYN